METSSNFHLNFIKYLQGVEGKGDEATVFLEFRQLWQFQLRKWYLPPFSDMASANLLRRVEHLKNRCLLLTFF